jgi:hypothetical protein
MRDRDGGMIVQKRVRIIPFLHGKLSRDGKMSEPDIYWILEKWLERHPGIKERHRDIQITRGRYTLANGARTELIDVTIISGKDIAGYDPKTDADLYEYIIAEDRGDEP